jgi:hypothetical protein
VDTFQTNPLSLVHLLSKIHERELALPDFQRDFVWDARATEELIESIARSFPAGSLLFMPWRGNTFAPRAVQGAPNLDGTTPDKLILDGQQRLSSLYQACYGVGDYRYFVDLGSLIGNGEIEEAVFYRHKNRCGPYASIEQQADRLVLPLGILFGGEDSGFHYWRDEILEHRPEQGDERKRLSQALQGVYQQHIKTIEDYRFPVVTLDQETSLEAICSIFETLNRTGIRLSVFDLLAARFYADGLDLRRHWQETVAEHPVIADFDVNKYYVLQSVALRVRASVKRGDVLKLTVADIEEHWSAVVLGFRRALEMLRDECGVRTVNWLPYGYLLVPLAALWRETIEIGGPTSAANRARLKQWFWCSGFSQAYDRAANTQAAKDFVELRTWTDGGKPPSTVTDFAFEPERLREITPKQQSIYKALMALVLRHGAADFHHGHTLTPASIDAQRVDDHHIFPRAYLNPTDEEAVVPLQLVDCILNRTLIDADTNQRIGKRPPHLYLVEVQAELEGAGAGLFEQVLESHLLPAGDDSPLLNDEFHAFLAWRADRILIEMAEVTGHPINENKATETAPAPS